MRYPKLLTLIVLLVCYFVGGNVVGQAPEQAPPTIEEGNYQYQDVVVGYRKVCHGNYCTQEPIVKRVLMRVSTVAKISVGSVAKTVDKVVPIEATRVNGPRWTYPGNIYDHLRTGHGVSGEGLSLREAEDYHSSLHNATRSSTVTYQSSSNCPGGVCPTNTTTRRKRNGWLR